MFSSKRIGPETRFAPVRIEARSDEVKSDEAKSDSSDADLEASIWPKLPPRKARVAKTSVKPHVEETRAEPPRAVAHVNARTKLARRHGNPLDAQATRYADPDLAVPVRRHLQLAAIRPLYARVIRLS